MIGSLSSRGRRRILFSASSLALLAASYTPALAQNDDTSQPPPAAAVPQPPAATPPTSSPTPTQAPQEESTAPAAAAPQQATGANVLPETRVVAPVERRQPRTRPPQVVANLPPAPTQAQVVATQNEKLDAARKTILAHRRHFL